MILKTLRAVNFKSLQDETIEFRKGVTLIRGLNESGKSTIMEAILYALYGYVLRPKTNPPKTKLIEYNSPRALVQLTFEISGKTYQVTREIFRSDKRSSKSNIVEILPDGKVVPKGTQSVTEVTNTVKSLLGDISYHELVSSCIVAQKELGKLVDLQAGDRKKIINVFLNLEHFNQITSRVKDWRRDLLGKREGGGGQIDSEKEKLEHLESELSQYEENSTEKEDKETKHTSLKNSLKDIHEKLAIEAPLLDVLDDYNEKQLAKKELDQGISSLNEQLKIQKNRLDKLGELETSRKDIQIQMDELNYIEDASVIIPDIRESVKEYQNLDQQIQTLAKTCTDQEEKLEEQSSKVEKVRPSADEQKILVSSVNLRIVGILVIAVSVLCILGIAINILFLLGSIPFIAVMVYVIYQYIRRVSLSEKNTQFLREKERLQVLSEGLENTRGQISTLDSNIISLNQVLEKKVFQLPSELQEIWESDNAESAQTILDQYDIRHRKYEGLQSDLDNIDKQLEEKPELEKEVSRLKQEIKSETEVSKKIILPNLPEGISFSERLLKDTREAVTDLRESIARIEQEVENIETRITELDTYLLEHKGIHEKHDNQKVKVDELIQEGRISQMILDAIETTSENLRNRVRPNVEQYMQRILPVITDNRYKAARLSETYDVEVWSDNAGEFQEKEMFSGGTEDQFLLAMRVAFALSLLPLRKYTRPDFLFLDEPLASSDVVRREGIMNLTQSVLSESFQQIIIISHVEELEDYVDNIIEVEAGKVRQGV